MTDHELIAYPEDDRWVGQCKCGWLVSGIESLDEIALMHGDHLRAVKE